MCDRRVAPRTEQKPDKLASGCKTLATNTGLYPAVVLRVERASPCVDCVQRSVITAAHSICTRAIHAIHQLDALRPLDRARPSAALPHPCRAWHGAARRICRHRCGERQGRSGRPRRRERQGDAGVGRRGRRGAGARAGHAALRRRRRARGPARHMVRQRSRVMPGGRPAGPPVRGARLRQGVHF